MCTKNSECKGKGGWCNPSGTCSRPAAVHDPCEPLAKDCEKFNAVCDPHSLTCLPPMQATINASHFQKHTAGGPCSQQWQCKSDEYCDVLIHASVAVDAKGECRKRLSLDSPCTVPTSASLLSHQLPQGMGAAKRPVTAASSDWYDDECENGLICRPADSSDMQHSGRCHRRCHQKSDCDAGHRCDRFSGLTKIGACVKLPEGVRPKVLLPEDKAPSKPQSADKASAVPEVPTEEHEISETSPTSGAKQGKVLPHPQQAAFWKSNTFYVVAAGISALLLVILLAALMYRCCRRGAKTIEDEEQEQEQREEQEADMLDVLGKPWWKRRGLLRKHRQHKKEEAKRQHHEGEPVASQRRNSKGKDVDIPIRTPLGVVGGEAQQPLDLPGTSRSHRGSVAVAPSAAKSPGARAQ